MDLGVFLLYWKTLLRLPQHPWPGANVDFILDKILLPHSHEYCRWRFLNQHFPTHRHCLHHFILDKMLLHCPIEFDASRFYWKHASSRCHSSHRECWRHFLFETRRLLRSPCLPCTSCFIQDLPAHSHWLLHFILDKMGFRTPLWVCCSFLYSTISHQSPLSVPHFILDKMLFRSPIWWSMTSFYTTPPHQSPLSAPFYTR